MNSPDNQDHRLFRFKQFSLSDKDCGMKIGTDGVLLGSLAASYKSKRTLDVGTGCGLIALMIAQKSDAKITAIELDRQASETAKFNVSQSPWASRIEVLNQSFQDFSIKTSEKFDLIVCNPPFFHNSQLTPIEERNLARHSDSLSPEDLINGSSKILAPAGTLLLIVPFDQELLWKMKASNEGFSCSRIVHILSKENLGPKRSVLEFSKKETVVKTDLLVIETDKRHQYSKDFVELTKDYYLFM